MDANQAELDRARNWLRLLFHAVVCPSSALATCELGDRCTEAKTYINQLMLNSAPPANAVLASVKGLLEHYISCRDARCSICVSVWTDLTLPSCSSATSTSTAAGTHQPGQGAGITQEDLGDAYAAAELLHYLLCCLLAHGQEHAAIVQKGKRLWEQALAPDLPEPMTVASRRLVQHRVTCQSGSACAVCGRALSFFARSNSRRIAAAAASPLVQPDALAMELEGMLTSMSTRLTDMRL